MNTKQNKSIFFCGLGEKPTTYKSLSKYFNIVSIDWNNIKIPKHKADIAIGFSFGGILACEYALKYKVKKLILCSMTTGMETLKDIKADEIVFLIGEKEKWVTTDIKRLLKIVKNRAKIIVIPKADHKIDNNYKNVLLQEALRK